MIYTMTFNPSVDLHLKLDTFKIGDINRSKDYKFYPGGKGINVSRVLNRLNDKSICLGFIGGHSGLFIEDAINKEGIKTDFIKIANPTRVNVKLDYKNETAINCPSPKITSKEIEEINKKISKLKKNDIYICSGALPSSISLDVFKKQLNILNKNKVKIVIDMSGRALKESIKYKPLLIKPNKDELEELYKYKIKNKDDVVRLARRAVKDGAVNVLVSLGRDGAVLVNKKDIFSINAPKGKVISTVGAGDSMLAGFIHEFIHSNNLYKSLVFATAVGSATAFSSDLANTKEINKVLKMIKHK